MNIGIMVHSQSGHTAAFAKAIADEVRARGHEAEISLLRPTRFVKPRSRNVTLRDTPDPSAYDAIVVASPVWAFTSAPVALAYLDDLAPLKGKKAIAVVTHALPAFLGAKRALTLISRGLEMLGAEVCKGEEIQWLFPPSKDKLAHAAKRVADTLD